ncbi:MAG: c-type cytochrome domain-containing protein [Pirellulales bacterium]
MKLLRPAIAGALCLWPVLVPAAKADEAPIPIAAIQRDTPVDFEKEILPILTKSCLACHNAKTAENALVLETPQTIAKGGDSGPVVVPGKSAESRLLVVASHADEPMMPPAGNEAGALALTSDQLGLVKQWIDEGAKGEVTRRAEIKWQQLPPGVNPIYAVALSPDAQYAACGRANQIFVYHVASGQLVTRLTDPALISSGMYEKLGVAHLDLAQSLAFSPDGELLASGGFREVKLWRRPHDVRRADLAGSTAAVESLATSSDGKWAATGEATGAIKLWDLSTLKDPRTLSGHSGPVTALGFTPDSTKLVSTSADKTIRLWNVADAAAAGQVETPAPINALAVLADGAQLATGHGDNAIRLWTLPAQAGGPFTPAAEITGHSGPITALAVSPSDKQQLVSAGADGSIRQWNLADGNKQIREIKQGAAVTALAVRPDGKQIASAGADNLVKLWNAADGQPWASPDKQPIAEMKGDFRAQFRVAQLDRAVAALNAKVADDKKAVADAEAKIIATSKAVTETQTAKDAAAKALAEKQAAVKAPTDAKTAADKELAAATEASKAAAEKAAQAKAVAEKDAQNADLAKANEEAKKAAEAADAKVKELEKKVQEAAAALAKAMQEAMSAEAANMAAEQAAAAAVAAVKKSVADVPLSEQALKDSEAALAQTQAESEAAKKTAAAADQPVRALAYSPDGSLLASAGDNNLVRTWMSDTAAPVETFAGHKAPVHAAAFGADGAILSAGADSAVILWNHSPAWTLARTIGNVADPATFVGRVTALAFSRDGKLLATGGGEPSRSGELKIWSVADGSLVRSLPDAHSDTVFGLEFSPDGVFLASSAADRFVKVFKVADGALARSYEGHTHHVLDVSWKSDGKVLASSGADNVIKVWDFLTGDQRRTTSAFGKEVTSLAFVGVMDKVVASSGDKTVRLVNTENGQMERTYSGSNDFMYSTATSADGRIAISGGQDSTLFVWLVDGGQLLKSFAAPKPEESQPVAQAAAN